MCESGGMRKGVEVRLGPGDRERLEGIVGSGNSPQKHGWRARVVLLRAGGGGTAGGQRGRARWRSSGRRAKAVRQSGAGKRALWRKGLTACCTRPPGRRASRRF